MDAHKFKKSLNDVVHRLSGLMPDAVRLSIVHFGNDVALVGIVPPFGAVFKCNLETEANHEALARATKILPITRARLHEVPVRFVEVQRQMLEDRPRAL